LTADLAEYRYLRHFFQRHERLEQSLAEGLHDRLIQQLAGALFCFENVQLSLAAAPAPTRAQFQDGIAALREAIGEARRILGHLRPLVCDGEDIVRTIECFVQQIAQPGGPEIDFQVVGEIGPLATDLENAVFRIVRELLTNACTHSASPTVELQLARTSDQIALTVTDWGRGFDPASVDGNTFGLHEAALRARLLGGELSIASTPGRGTRVIVSLPARAPQPTPDENNVPARKE